MEKCTLGPLLYLKLIFVLIDIAIIFSQNFDAGLKGVNPNSYIGASSLSASNPSSNICPSYPSVFCN